MSRRQLLRGLALVAVSTPLLGGCASSFRPMYAAGNDQRLAKVEMGPIPGRVGQRIRNELVFQATGGGEAVSPTHRLEFAITESLTSTLVTRSGEALSQIYNLDVKFRLVNIAEKKVVLEGTSTGRSGFERFTTGFANVRAREDAENKAAKVVAEELRTRIMAYLATNA